MNASNQTRQPTPYPHSASTDERGNIALMTAAAIGVILLIVGATLDMSRSVHAARNLQDALDHAALSAARQTSQDNASQHGEMVFAANIDADGFNDLRSSFSLQDDVIRATASADVPLLFGSLFGKSKTAISADTVINLDQGATLNMTPASASASPSRSARAITD